MKKGNMNVFKVEAEVCLGFRCFGSAVTETGCATLELTDEELQTLVEFINRSGSVDVEGMGLEEKLPEIYEKLDDAYREAAAAAEEDHWLEVGWDNSDVFDQADALEYAEKELGYTFQFDPEEYLDADGQLDEDAVEDDKMEDFSEWLTSYKDSLEGEERRKFMRKFIEVDVQGLEYEVKIPEEILDICSKGAENSSANAGKITCYAPYNGYMIFEEEGKVGFIDQNSDTMSPLFDDVDVIEMGEAIRVKKDGVWGFLAEDFTFLPEKEVEVNDDLSDMIYWFGRE